MIERIAEFCIHRRKAVVAVLDDRLSPAQAVGALMGREAKAEGGAF